MEVVDLVVGKFRREQGNASAYVMKKWGDYSTDGSVVELQMEGKSYREFDDDDLSDVEPLLMLPPPTAVRNGYSRRWLRSKEDLATPLKNWNNV